MKKRVRDILEPGRSLGHIDGVKKNVESGAKAKENEVPGTRAEDEPAKAMQEAQGNGLGVFGDICEDCKYDGAMTATIKDLSEPTLVKSKKNGHGNI